MKKIIKRAVSILAGAVIVGLVGTCVIFREEISMMQSIKRVREDLPIYTMEINGDYYLDELLEQGGVCSDHELSTFLTERMSHGFYKADIENKGAGCSTISSMNKQGRHVWGRNFDWTEAVPIIVKHHADTGYDSISTCHFGNVVNEVGGKKALPEGIANKMLAIAALYVPMDGINEKGLCVADLEVNEGGMVEVDTQKPDLTITTAIHLVLNRAATVEEAVAILKAYDIHTSADISHHFSIADAQGNSVAVEFVNGEVVVVPTPYITNFNMLSEDHAVGGESAKRRFETLEAYYNDHQGTLEAEEIREALQQVAQIEGQWKTRWSIVYDSSEQTASYYFEGHLDEEPLVFKIEQ